MASSNWVPVILLFVFSYTSAEVVRNEGRGEVGKGYTNQLGGRALMGFKETPSGGNITYECSPSGPCIPCAYSEKNDEKYRCSETGYRIPLKCVAIESGSKEVKGKKEPKGRSTLESIHCEVNLLVKSNAAEGHASSLTRRHLLDESSGSEDGKQAYITYRSCIPAVNEERFSVIGFEVS
ncbi:OLC1v1028123C3 [Oldenlandia corymbosa var. corymbosa]|uniref:OLC1v1028123C3 n=1 Tax=Oldenlandia corymbosa var. corymbosa TaxID=529605 RepID=A0AAV1CD12_OLDCO|nr:OLC1v1028123C3 [Oldenlandia corymbosa var. corymbosa]